MILLSKQLIRYLWCVIGVLYCPECFLIRGRRQIQKIKTAKGLTLHLVREHRAESFNRNLEDDHNLLTNEKFQKIKCLAKLYLEKKQKLNFLQYLVNEEYFKGEIPC